jgi:hypothetical protein
LIVTGLNVLLIALNARVQNVFKLGWSPPPPPPVAVAGDGSVTWASVSLPPDW